MFRRKLQIGLLCLAVAASAATAMAGMDDFKLARAVPGDVFMVVHSRSHAGQEFLRKQIDRVWAALEEQHLEQDFQKMIKGMMASASSESQPNDTAAFEEQFQRFSELLTAIDCDALFGNETAVAMKIDFPMTQVVVLAAPKNGKTEEVFTAISKLAQELVALAPGKINLATTGEGSSVVHVISPAEAPLPIGLTLARQGDVILLGLGTALPEQTLALLRGESDAQPLMKSERFRNAFKDLPDGKDSISFVDLDRLFKQLNAMIAQVPMDEAPENVRALPGQVLAEFDVFDWVASVATTDGMKTTVESIAVVKPGTEGRLVYKAFMGGKPLKDPLKHVPVTASNFSAMSGIDTMALYNGVIDFVREKIPDGAAHIQEWEAMKQQLPFDLEKDLLAFVGGQFISFQLPGRSAYSPSDWVTLASLNEAERAKSKLNELTEWGRAMLQKGQGSNGSLNEATVSNGTGFVTFVSPVLMMAPGFSSPTYGIQGDWMYLASGPKPIDASLATAGGSQPSFAENERFRKEGVSLDVSGLYAASFTDMTKMADEISGLLNMVPMLGMMAPDIYKNPAGRMVMSVVPKLAKVAKKLDFFQSSSSRTTFDGKRMHTLQVTNYREPPAPPAPAATETSAGSN
jgi:hypothetical protein